MSPEAVNCPNTAINNMCATDLTYGASILLLYSNATRQYHFRKKEAILWGKKQAYPIFLKEILYGKKYVKMTKRLLMYNTNEIQHILLNF